MVCSRARQKSLDVHMSQMYNQDEPEEAEERKKKIKSITTSVPIWRNYWKCFAFLGFIQSDTNNKHKNEVIHLRRVMWLAENKLAVEALNRCIESLLSQPHIAQRTREGLWLVCAFLEVYDTNDECDWTNAAEVTLTAGVKGHCSEWCPLLTLSDYFICPKNKISQLLVSIDVSMHSDV